MKLEPLAFTSKRDAMKPLPCDGSVTGIVFVSPSIDTSTSFDSTFPYALGGVLHGSLHPPLHGPWTSTASAVAPGGSRHVRFAPATKVSRHGASFPRPYVGGSDIEVIVTSCDDSIESASAFAGVEGFVGPVIEAWIVQPFTLLVASSASTDAKNTARSTHHRHRFMSRDTSNIRTG
jgi:hypothetical protein